MSYLEKYGYAPSEEETGRFLEKVAANIKEQPSPDKYRECFSFMDLTTLHTDDTEESVANLVGKVNALPSRYPSYPLPASVCVYPNFASTLRKSLTVPEVHVTAVAGCFPSSQSFPEVKVRECELAVLGGADEVDIVLALNSFLAGDYDSAASEIRAVRNAVDAAAASVGRKAVLKVILETGLLKTPEKIAEASFLAMEAGADFIKTSTGKVDVNATPMAAAVMCGCILKFFEKTGRRVGFKAAGGISTAQDAICYYYIVANILGKEWLCQNLFRLGVSRLGNSLMSAIEQQTVSFF